MYRILIFFSVLILVKPLLCSQNPTYTLAVVPQYNVSTQQREWLPIVEYLEKKLYIKINLKLYNNVDDYEADLYAGNFDFSYMSPHHIVLVRKSVVYEPLLTSSDEKLVGLIVVPIGSNIQKIQDLKNKTIAFPSVTAVGASAMIRAHLTEVAKIPFQTNYMGNHDNTYRAVLYGKASAAGAVNKSLYRQPMSVQKKLRIIFSLPSISSHPFAAKSKLPSELKKRVTEELLSYSKTAEGGKQLQMVGLSKPILANYEKDYKKLEKLRLEKYLKL